MSTLFTKLTKGLNALLAVESFLTIDVCEMKRK